MNQLLFSFQSTTTTHQSSCANFNSSKVKQKLRVFSEFLYEIFVNVYVKIIPVIANVSPQVNFGNFVELANARLVEMATREKLKLRSVAERKADFASFIEAISGIAGKDPKNHPMFKLLEMLQKAINETEAPAAKASDPSTRFLNLLQSVETSFNRQVEELMRKYIDIASINFISMLTQLTQQDRPDLNEVGLMNLANGFKSEIEKRLTKIRTLLGGFRNAYKSFFGLAKVVSVKAKQAKTWNAKAVKQGILGLKHLLSKMAQLNMALLILFDTMNGVYIDSAEPYNYQESNFVVNDNQIEPTRAFLRRFVKASGEAGSITKRYEITNSDQETKPQLALKESKLKEKVAHETVGCVAFQGGWMTQFFNQMDSLCCKLVDLAA